MAIQTRRGAYDDFDPAKMLPGELATVTSGDPGADDGRSVYACFAAGDVKRMATYEDMEENIDQATQDVQEAFSAQLTQKISQADTAISQAQTAASAANIAAQGANEAKQEALEAAEAAESYVLGDISNKTVVFSEASTRENINTGESTSTLFGKIKKWFSDLGDAINRLNTKTANLSGMSIAEIVSLFDTYGEAGIGYKSWNDAYATPDRNYSFILYTKGVAIAITFGGNIYRATVESPTWEVPS